MTTPRATRRAYWACQLGGWYGLALLQIGVVAGAILLLTDHSPLSTLLQQGEIDSVLQQAAALRTLSIRQAATELLLLHSAGLLLSHSLYIHLHRQRWPDLPLRTLLPRAMLAGLILGAPLGLAQSRMAIAVLHEAPPGAPAGVGLLLHVLNWAGTFWLWIALHRVLVGIRRRRGAELRQSELLRALHLAELRLLKDQLNPHFLFNALNSVRALIADDPPRAQQAVTQLARTLRYTLGSSQDEQVTLEQELEIVDDYLGLEALRLGERLGVERDIDPGARRARIPVMLLQTLVENAIKHGIAQLPEGGHLKLDAKLQGNMLVLEVDNPRPQAPVAGIRDGIGLRNSQQRLHLLHGENATLHLDLSAPDRALARVRIPQPLT